MLVESKVSNRGMIMAASPPYKVFRDGEYVASVKYLEDAAAIVGMSGEGGVVKYGHNKVIWTEGSEELEASESYDGAAAIMQARVDKLRNPSPAKPN